MHALLRRVPLGLVLLLLAACGDSTGPARVASIEISPADPRVVFGGTAQLSAIARDGRGNALTDRAITWATNDAAVVRVGTSGMVVGLAVGTAVVSASSEGQQATTTIRVEPRSVATISVDPTSARLVVEQTRQLSAKPLDAVGNLLIEHSIAWSSTAPAVAEVSASGLVRAVAPGTATIRASAGNMNGMVEIVVVEAGAMPIVTAVSPSTLTEGATGTITGSGFLAEAGANTVLIDGVRAAVTAATTTKLTFTVPRADCRPRREAEVKVTVGEVTSEPVVHAVRPVAFAQVAVGQQVILTDPSDFCLQFDATSANEQYLVGIQSVSETPGSVTPTRVAGTAGMRAGTAAAPAAAASRALRPQSGAPGVMPARPARWAAHRAGEARLRAAERSYMEPLLRSRRSIEARTSLRARTAAAVAEPPAVGDTLQLRFPDRTQEVCTATIPVRAVVRAVGRRGVWLEDVKNPSGGFTTADFEELSRQFDDVIYTTNTDYFGEPTDIDGNDRVLILTTQEINRYNQTSAGGGVLGFVASADLIARSVSGCEWGNEAEIYYGLAPDPTGELWEEYPREYALADAPLLIAHEFAHIIQMSRRLSNPGFRAFPAIWEMEGQATLAEEVVGHAMTGRQQGKNYGFSVAFNNPESSPVSWYMSGFTGLAVYFGFQSPTQKARGAPEECTWQESEGGPCLGGDVYGTPWSLLRWISDQYGPAYPGGEKALQRALIDQNPTLAGYRNLAAVTGVPMPTMLAQWAAALYVDDRVLGLDPRLRFTSWNLADVFGHLVGPAQLRPREITFDSTFVESPSVRAGSTAYFLLSGVGRPAAAFHVLSQSGGTLPAHMQLWVVRTR